MLRPPLESAQYCSIEYQAELRKHGILISMSGKGNCYDNSMVETFFKTLKSELVWRTVFLTRAEASDATGRYIDRLHQSRMPLPGPGPGRAPPCPATSPPSTIPSGATRRWASSAPPSSKGAPPAKPLSTEPNRSESTERGPGRRWAVRGVTALRAHRRADAQINPV